MSTKVCFRDQRRLARLGAVITIATICVGGSVMAHGMVHTSPVSPGPTSARLRRTYERGANRDRKNPDRVGALIGVCAGRLARRCL